MPQHKAEYIEAIHHNGRLRDECLNVTQFTSLDDARRMIEARRQDYNHTRPHSSLWNLTPHEFAQQGQQKRINEGGNFALRTGSKRGRRREYNARLKREDRVDVKLSGHSVR